MIVLYLTICENKIYTKKVCYNENSFIIEFNIWYKTLKSKSYIFYNIILLNLYIMVTIT